MIKSIGAGFPDENWRRADHTGALWRSGGFGQDALAQHQSYMSISVDATDEALVARIRAARLLNAVTAVFTKRPITLAIYVKWTGHFVRPDAWGKAAEDAVNGEWPPMSWVSYRGAWNVAASNYAVG